MGRWVVGNPGKVKMHKKKGLSERVCAPGRSGGGACGGVCEPRPPAKPSPTQQNGRKAVCVCAVQCVWQVVVVWHVHGNRVW